MSYQLGSGTPQLREPRRRTGPSGEARGRGGGEGEGQTTIGISLCTSGLTERRVPLVQATVSEKPLAQVMEDQALLVRATGGQVLLVWIKGSRGLSVMWCLFCVLQVAGTNQSSHLRNQMEASSATTRGL